MIKNNDFEDNRELYKRINKNSENNNFSYPDSEFNKILKNEISDIKRYNSTKKFNNSDRQPINKNEKYFLI